MYKLNHKSRNYIKSKIGIDFDKIIEMDSNDLDSLIESKIHKKLEHKPFSDDNYHSRGTPYLFSWRVLGIKKVDKLLKRI